MTPEQAADLAARTLAAIPTLDDDDTLGDGWQREVIADHRERVASDLAGLLDPLSGKRDRARYADGLRRTAALYGVTE